MLECLKHRWSPWSSALIWLPVLQNAVRMPAVNMFPGHPLPDHTDNQVLIAPSSADILFSAASTAASTFEQGFVAATSKPPQLPPEWAEKAASELNETPEAVQENIKSLRRMVLGTANSHLYLAHPTSEPLWYPKFRHSLYRSARHGNIQVSFSQ